MTVIEYKNFAVEKLSSITDNPEFEAVQLMCFALKLSKNKFLLERKMKLNDIQLSQLNSVLERRISREPLQYIIGEWEFYGYKMYCGPGCLIPRPETEMLVDIAVKSLPNSASFLDLCTGSGCISVSILNSRPDVNGSALDISEAALKYAKRNIELYSLNDRINLYCEDINGFVPLKKYNLIISNPPYIKSKDMENLSPEVKKEPDIALDGGEDGLQFYKLILEKYSKYLADDGSFLFEVGYDIADDVAKIYSDAGYNTEVLTDIYGNKRVCKAATK